MNNSFRVACSDLRGLARLAVEATAGAADLAEAMHDSIGRPAPGSSAIKGLVYGAIRRVTQLAGGGLETVLSHIAPGGTVSSLKREALVAALNGVLGDHLEATGNPLAIPMEIRQGGRPLVLESAALAAALPRPRSRLLVLVHGLCRSDLHWLRGGHDHGAALARDLGWTPLYLRYNSGRHVSANGMALADLLETLLARWPEPVERLALLAHSMGGLVARSACRQAEEAGQAWRQALGQLVLLGTPNHGAPLERGGQWLERILEVSPFTGPLARLGRMRSAGITDLRHGSLLEEDWRGRDRFADREDTRTPVPLPEGVESCVIAATTGGRSGPLGGFQPGDGIVPLDSALGRHPDPRFSLDFPEDRLWIAGGMNHLDLLSRPEVYERIRGWLGA